MLFIALVLSSTSGENYWKKIFLWAHLLSSKMARLLSSSPIMMFYVSPLQLLAKTSGVSVETFLKAVVIC